MSSWIQEAEELFKTDISIDDDNFVDYTDASQEVVDLFDDPTQELDDVSGVGDFSD